MRKSKARRMAELVEKEATRIPTAQPGPASGADRSQDRRIGVGQVPSQGMKNHHGDAAPGALRHRGQYPANRLPGNTNRKGQMWEKRSSGGFEILNAIDTAIQQALGFPVHVVTVLGGVGMSGSASFRGMRKG